MSDEQAVEIAKHYGLPIVRIPPTGCIDEIITVNMLDRHRPPIVTRGPSSNFGPGQLP